MAETLMVEHKLSQHCLLLCCQDYTALMRPQVQHKLFLALLCHCMRMLHVYALR
jgi:hypothetical protein